jgi:hypothetical protein
VQERLFTWPMHTMHTVGECACRRPLIVCSSTAEVLSEVLLAGCADVLSRPVGGCSQSQARHSVMHRVGCCLVKLVRASSCVLSGCFHTKW